MHSIYMFETVQMWSKALQGGIILSRITWTNKSVEKLISQSYPQIKLNTVQKCISKYFLLRQHSTFCESKTTEPADFHLIMTNEWLLHLHIITFCLCQEKSSTVKPLRFFFGGGFFLYEWLERQERAAFKVGAADNLMTTSISRAQCVCRHHREHFTGLYNIIHYKSKIRPLSVWNVHIYCVIVLCTSDLNIVGKLCFSIRYDSSNVVLVYLLAQRKW